MPRTLIAPILDEESRRRAVEVWRAARTATDRPPTPERLERVAAKVADRVDAGHLALLAHYGERPAGMLVAEPYRGDDGSDPAAGHLSMVFVDPALWGCGVAGALVRSVQRGDHGPGWTRLSVWTREANRRALRLYRARGFTDTGETTTLHEGEVIRRLEWRADAP
ncbi:GNAT family N-acetyltransferase [Nocardioides okcheonensis]|uniref:GNAT family N-acetyltransferase n=1 Tax=Nocardioides okcheonensis TaxID=2894081 RepID=UPI001E4BD559|nr:GNAT family N-acetyltransferase [Nocardioides okcheonensis]UFN45573.1 GNAT family N-acetyltransferase [Nocardioides okcheonensis]